MAKLTVTSLVVLTENIETGKSGEFVAWLLPNGAVRVIGHNTSDSYFESESTIEANGNDKVVDVTRTYTLEIYSNELVESIQRSVRDQGKDAVPANVLQFLS